MKSPPFLSKKTPKKLFGVEVGQRDISILRLIIISLRCPLMVIRMAIGASPFLSSLVFLIRNKTLNVDLPF
ncbi:hypothetical protein BN938_2504 [Mucinivorans hirudinis]|uniref:Uncharacterized protein n=1 Tax=Mucinivorans hirudinis TaxID=1433126 RepID=A0A060REC4_9BACT|nr:hypothetical protein BN938_2504 [Mucinivorans hirudinis]